MPVDRCLFRMSREIDGVMKTCVVLTYVDDLLVVGDSELQAEVSSAIAARFADFSQWSSHAASNSATVLPLRGGRDP